MGFNLSKGERFDLSKSSSDTATGNSFNARLPITRSKDITVIILVVLTILVIALNASLWYHVLEPLSSAASINKNEKISK